MLRVIFPIAALLLSVALLQTGNGLQGTLLPIRGAAEQFSTFSIGLLGSTYFTGFIAGCILGPRLVSQVGHIRVFTAMAALASATPLAHGLILTPMPWWILRVVTGFCFAVLYIVIESWLNERATKQTRGSVFAIYLVINMTVMTLGQLMIIVFDVNEFALFAITSILVSIAAVPVALSIAPAPAPIHQSGINLFKVYAISPVGFIGCLCIGAANGAFWALAPQYAGASGLDAPGIAVFMSITVIAGALGQWPIGLISDRYDRRKVMTIVSALAAIAGGILWWLGEFSGYLPYAIAALWGFLSFPIYGLAVAHSNDFAKPDQFVEVSSALLLIYATGAIIGPMVAAALMTYLHASFLYAHTAVAHLILIAFIAWRSKQRDPAPSKEHVRYIDALEASQSASSTMDAVLQEQMVKAAEVETAGEINDKEHTQ